MTPIAYGMPDHELVEAAGLPQSLGLRSLTSDVVPGLAFLAGGVVAIAA